MNDERTVDDYDVVVVGHGIAGVTTALAAAEAGVSTAILEKSPSEERGGSTRFTGGAFMLPIGEPERIRDLFDLSDAPRQFTREEFVDAFISSSNGRADQSLVDAAATEAVDGLTWLAERGIEWELPVSDEFDGYGQYDGAIRVAGGGDTRGAELIDELAACANSLGVETHYETTVREFLTDEAGRIRGVVAKRGNRVVTYESNAVVVCSGSFTASPEKRARYLTPDGDLYHVRGTRHNTGELLEAALDEGANAAGRWSGAHTVMIHANSETVECGQTKLNGFQYGILLNREGERFIDEGQHFSSKSYAAFGGAVHEQPGHEAYLIFDSRTADHVVNFGGDEPIEAKTLPELLRTLDIDDTEAAQRTIREYNDSTTDDPFVPTELDGKRTRGLRPSKSNWATPIAEPPFKCHPVVAGITFAYGGLEVDTNSRVLDTTGQPIDGLWAVGNVTGGLFYDRYPSGAALTTSVVFGRRAGEAAAAAAENGT